MSGLIKQQISEKLILEKWKAKVWSIMESIKKEEIKNLALQASQGDRAAYGKLYEETGRSVYFSCLKLLANTQLAEDITQETFLTALQKLPTLSQPENFGAWVNRIAVNKCKMYFRNPAAEENSDDILEEVPDEDLIPEDYVSNDAKRKIIMDIIEKVITDEQRQTVILYYFNMLTVAEIADIMKCTTGTVTSRLSAARKKIKEAVLIYEKNNDDRLHTVVPVFTLSKLLMQEASKAELPKITLFTDTSAASAKAISDSTTASAETVSGGKGMLATVKSKVIAGVCAAAVAGGVITAAVMLNSDNDDNGNEAVSSQIKANTTISKSEDINNGSTQTDSEDNAAPVQTELTNSGLWDGELLVNGKVIKMPITSKELTDLGYEISDDDKGDGDITTDQTFMYVFQCIDPTTNVSVNMGNLLNEGSSTLDYGEAYGTEDFVYYQMMFSGLDNEENEYSVEMSNGITIGSSAEDVVNAFGEPTKVTYYDAYIYIQDPDAVADKDDPYCKESAYVRFNMRDDRVTAITIGAKADR